MAAPAIVPFIPAIIGGATALFQGIKSAQERKRAGDMPKYEIPEEMFSAMSEAERRALQGLTPEQRKTYIDTISRNQSANIRNLTSRQAGIAGVGQLAQAGTDAAKELTNLDANMQTQNINQRNALLGTFLNQNRQAFDINQLAPYQQLLASSQANTGASIQNLIGGVNSGVSNYLAGQNADKMMQSFGGGQTQLPTTTTNTASTVNTTPVQPTPSVPLFNSAPSGVLPNSIAPNMATGKTYKLPDGRVVSEAEYVQLMNLLNMKFN